MRKLQKLTILLVLLQINPIYSFDASIPNIYPSIPEDDYYISTVFPSDVPPIPDHYFDMAEALFQAYKEFIFTRLEENQGYDTALFEQVNADLERNANLIKVGLLERYLYSYREERDSGFQFQQVQGDHNRFPKGRTLREQLQSCPNGYYYWHFTRITIWDCHVIYKEGEDPYCRCIDNSTGVSILPKTFDRRFSRYDYEAAKKRREEKRRKEEAERRRRKQEYRAQQRRRAREIREADRQYERMREEDRQDRVIAQHARGAVKKWDSSEMIFEQGKRRKLLPGMSLDDLESHINSLEMRIQVAEQEKQMILRTYYKQLETPNIGSGINLKNWLNTLDEVIEVGNRGLKELQGAYTQKQERKVAIERWKRRDKVVKQMQEESEALWERKNNRRGFIWRKQEALQELNATISKGGFGAHTQRELTRAKMRNEGQIASAQKEFAEITNRIEEIDSLIRDPDWDPIDDQAGVASSIMKGAGQFLLGAGVGAGVKGLIDDKSSKNTREQAQQQHEEKMQQAQQHHEESLQHDADEREKQRQHDADEREKQRQHELQLERLKQSKK